MYAGMYADTPPEQLALYARHAADLLDVEVEDDWWPGVLSYLALFLSRADIVAAADDW